MSRLIGQFRRPKILALVLLGFVGIFGVAVNYFGVERSMYSLLAAIDNERQNIQTASSLDPAVVTVTVPDRLDGMHLVFAGPYSIQTSSLDVVERFGRRAVGKMAAIVDATPHHHVFCFGAGWGFSHIEDPIVFGSFVAVVLEAPGLLVLTFEGRKLVGMQVKSTGLEESGAVTE